MSQTSYFKPLRRKIGVLTLAMACVLMAGWVRSLTIVDTFYFPTGWRTSFTTSTAFQSIILRVGFDGEWNEAFYWKTYRSSFFAPYRRQDILIEPAEAENVVWFCQLSGFGIGETPREMHDELRQLYVMISFLWVAIPLTLLSAWLLLSKPRVKTELPITPTIETT